MNHLPITHPDYIDDMYAVYQKNPESLNDTWRSFFEGFDLGIKGSPQDSTTIQNFKEQSNTLNEIRVCDLISAYRSRGHLEAKTNPIRERKDRKARLSLKDFNLTEDMRKETFQAGAILNMPLQEATLEEIENSLKITYAGSIGFEYMAIREPEILTWFQSKVEREKANFQLSAEEKQRILEKLTQAVGFEQYLHKKYIGQKRFSLEGGEATIPALDIIIQQGIDWGAKEFYIGMAHRGRLNVLANIMQKPLERIFHEFEGGASISESQGDGDVKYHLNYSSTLQVKGKKIRLHLLANPSHLEAVDPVVQGHVRARLDQKYEHDFNKVIPILIHGDAAVAGQGIVYEVLQMSRLAGYNVGGTIHFIINNQIGFTTDFEDARSSVYCTALSGLVEAPELHVNGDNPEALAFAVQLAIEFRQRYHRDIFIDLVCYRKYGHNESDEPKFTQPLLYDIIKKHKNIRDLYSKQLIDEGVLSSQAFDDMRKAFEQKLDKAANSAQKNTLKPSVQISDANWYKFVIAQPKDFLKSPITGISRECIEKIGTALTTLPEGFQSIKQIERLIQERKKNFFDKHILNWADAELLSYGSLLSNGYPVRISGQDVIRGTFSHRHAVVRDRQTNEAYSFLNNIKGANSQLMIYNSLLSEYGVLGFEYGYASTNPNCLVIWEAQFGDFSNGAQIIIDQFIASSESKWMRMSGLVMLLPHGYEGQGPEHSNARPERYLQLSAENNMIVVNITTPANLFHLMRRQMLWNFRKPCIVMSPKSLLRHPLVKSPLSDFDKETSFKEVIADTFRNPKDIKKVLLCTGKIYYELAQYRQEHKISDTAIIRVEQLHPFPENQLQNELDKYANSTKLIWVQEEPVNMGYWTYILHTYHQKKNLELVARKPSASPATGNPARHQREQQRIIEASFKR